MHLPYFGLPLESLDGCKSSLYSCNLCVDLGRTSSTKGSSRARVCKLLWLCSCSDGSNWGAATDGCRWKKFRLTAAMAGLRLWSHCKQLATMGSKNSSPCISCSSDLLLTPTCSTTTMYCNLQHATKQHAVLWHLNFGVDVKRDVWAGKKNLKPKTKNLKGSCCLRWLLITLRLRCWDVEIYWQLFPPKKKRPEREGGSYRAI